MGYSAAAHESSEFGVIPEPGYVIFEAIALFFQFVTVILILITFVRNNFILKVDGFSGIDVRWLTFVLKTTDVLRCTELFDLDIWPEYHKFLPTGKTCDIDG